jgi:hypothetical protein
MKTKFLVAYVEGTGHLLHRFRKIDEISETIFSLMKRKNDRKKIGNKCFDSYIPFQGLKCRLCLTFGRKEKETTYKRISRFKHAIQFILLATTGCSPKRNT